MPSSSDEQFELKRVADAAIDIYSAVGVLSRVSGSLLRGVPSAQHERLMCRVWCDEVSHLAVCNVLCHMFGLLIN